MFKIEISASSIDELRMKISGLQATFSPDVVTGTVSISPSQVAALDPQAKAPAKRGPKAKESAPEVVPATAEVKAENVQGAHAGPAITKPQLISKIQEIMGVPNFSHDKVQKILIDTTGASALSQVDPAKYGALYVAVEKKLAELKAS